MPYDDKKSQNNSFSPDSRTANLSSIDLTDNKHKRLNLQQSGQSIIKLQLKGGQPMVKKSIERCTNKKSGESGLNQNNYFSMLEFSTASNVWPSIAFSGQNTTSKKTK